MVISQWPLPHQCQRPQEATWSHSCTVAYANCCANCTLEVDKCKQLVPTQRTLCSLIRPLPAAAYQCCMLTDMQQIFCMLEYLSLALYPGPFLREGMVHITCACDGSPQKNLGGSDITEYLSVYAYISVHACRACISYYGNVTGCDGDTDRYMIISNPPIYFLGDLAHAHTMCTRPFSLLAPLKKGPGYEANFPLLVYVLLSLFTLLVPPY